MGHKEKVKVGSAVREAGGLPVSHGRRWALDGGYLQHAAICNACCYGETLEAFAKKSSFWLFACLFSACLTLCSVDKVI